jgi:hypothetical protein
VAAFPKVCDCFCVYGSCWTDFYLPRPGLSPWAVDHPCCVHSSGLKRPPRLEIRLPRRFPLGLPSALPLHGNQYALVRRLSQRQVALYRAFFRWPIWLACDRVPSHWQSALVFALSRSPLRQRLEVEPVLAQSWPLVAASSTRLPLVEPYCGTMSRACSVAIRPSRGTMSSPCAPSVRLSCDAMLCIRACSLPTPCSGSALTTHTRTRRFLEVFTQIQERLVAEGPGTQAFV